MEVIESVYTLMTAMLDTFVGNGTFGSDVDDYVSDLLPPPGDL